jgi:hypothetical protein
VQDSITSTAPQLRQLVQQPGAAELVQEVAQQLSQRFAARVIKFAFGSQEASRTSAAL